MRAPRATAYARSLEQRISLITLGVNNVERSRRFYEELGWTGQLLEETVFFQAGGQAVVLWDWQKLAADAGVVDDGSNFGGIVLAHNVRSRPGVDELIQRAASAGATITRHPSEMFYGGYAGCFRDVDGHVWEIAINPGFPLDELGNLTVPWTWETALVSDTETVWMIAVGVVGLAGFVAGSYLTDPPRVDSDLEEALARVRSRRSAVLSGSTLTAVGGGLLLWPIAFISTAGSGAAWASLALFSIVIAALTMSFLVVTAVFNAALAWRDPTALSRPTARLVLDGVHLGIWSVSGPLAAIMVSAATAVGWQNDLLGPAVVVAAAVKVGTVVVELAGIGVRTGWNAGGWARGASGYATVAWFALVLIALA